MADRNSTYVAAATAPTMTSLELVAFINEDRRAKAEAAGAKFPSKGYAELLHKSFLPKVIDVLGAETSAKFFADLPDSYGRLQPGYRFPKREACLMAMSYSYELQAKVFDRMTALESNRLGATPFADAVLGAEVVCRVMRLEGSAALGVLRSVTEITAPHLLPALPVYAIDAPAGSGSASSEATASATTLLAEAGKPMSAAVFNQRAESLGLLKQLGRPSKKSPVGIALYWSITESGLKYGKNLTSTANQRETQPHWYRARFGELLQLVLGQEGGAA